MATPRKAATKAADDDTVVDAGNRFAELRDRARKNRRGRARQTKDFVLGKEDGFDPEIRVKFPLQLQQERSFYYALKEGDVYEQVRVLLGGYEFEQLLDFLAQFDDSSDLFVGFADMLLEHWAGKGATDVAGGSGES